MREHQEGRDTLAPVLPFVVDNDHVPAACNEHALLLEELSVRPVRVAHTAIGVPKAGAKIEIVGVCTITVSPAEASAVIGSWHDGTKAAGAEASWTRIKEQVNFKGCEAVGATPPAVYAGEVRVNNITAGATEPIGF